MSDNIREANADLTEQGLDLKREYNHISGEEIGVLTIGNVNYETREAIAPKGIVPHRERRWHE